MKIPIASPISPQQQQSNQIPPVYRQPPIELLHHPLSNNTYSTNLCFEATGDSQCLHGECQLSNTHNAMEESTFIMNLNPTTSPSIHMEKSDPSLSSNPNILHLDPYTTPHPHLVSVQNLPKTLTHPSQSALTTLLAPSTSLNPNDVVMTSSTTFSLLRSVSPIHLLPGSMSATNSSIQFHGTMDYNEVDNRKPYVSGNFEALREDSVSMTTLENNHCSTLLF